MNLKKYTIHIVILAMLATFALPLNIGVADFSSGSKIFISDVVIFIVSFVYIGLFLFKKIAFNKRQIIFLSSIAIFISYLLFSAGLHTFLSGFSKEYIVLIRNFYSSAFLLLFLSSNKITKKTIEEVILIFITISNGYQLIYLCTHSEIRSSPLFFNIVIYSVVAQIILAVLFKISSVNRKKESKLKRIVVDSNILLILILVPFTGLRSSMVVTYTLTLFYILYFTLLYGKKMFIKSIICFLILFLGTVSVLTVGELTNNSSAKNVLLRTFSITKSNKNKPRETNTTIVKDSDGSESDAYRNVINAEATKIIKDNLFFGTGKLLIQIKHPSGRILVQQPHGFLLEWLIGYGIIGTTIYVCFLLLPYYFRKMKFYQLKYFIMSLSVLIGLLMISIVQPTMSRILPMQIFMMVQVYFMKVDLENKHKKRRLSPVERKIKNTDEKSTQDSELRELQLIMLKNMKIIHQICTKHKIMYSLCSGSAIGAIVHRGFIPWDDDIDIMMDRKNYDRFRRIIQKELPSNLQLIDYTNSKESRTLISKIVDNDFIITYQNTNGEKLDMGLFIDITVLDKIPTDPEKRKKVIQKSKLGLLLIGRNTPKNQGLLFKILGWLLINCTTDNFKIKFGKKTERFIKKSVKNGEDFKYAELLIYCGKLYEFEENLFTSYELVQFEDTKLYITSDYDRYLRHRYERDYTVLPDKSEQVPHHGILDVKRINK